MRKVLALGLVAILLNPAMLGAAPQPNMGRPSTKIKHLVIIFQENVSFDHYFGTYPQAKNLLGETPFFSRPETPMVNGLSATLLNNNPNLNPANGTGATNPFRLSPLQASTADQDHDYTPEQQAFHGGLMDLFPLYTGLGGMGNGSPFSPSPTQYFNNNGLVMGYYDGNTVTALWNYAQHFAMNDNSFDTNFGPSTPGALNVVSGQSNGATDFVNGTGALIGDGYSGWSVISDADPGGDVCSTKTGETFMMSGNNVGNLLDSAGVSWGFFSGGFDLTITNNGPGGNGMSGCNRKTTSAITGVSKADYIPHHQPFQYYASTANPTHARPLSAAEIGHAGPANHQYDIHDFFDAVSSGNFPAVSYLKAPGYQDGHAGYSDPIDEQNFIVNTINFLQSQPEWRDTAVIIAYDDSDGWYDHQMSPIVNQSATTADDLTGGSCGSGTAALRVYNDTSIPPTSPTRAQGRCGYGPRLPFLVISPWAKENYVDHTLTDQSSVVRFIEDNWLDGERITGSFDAIAGSIENMFDFSQPDCRQDKHFLSYITGEHLDHFPGWPSHFPFWGWGR